MTAIRSFRLLVSLLVTSSLVASSVTRRTQVTITDATTDFVNSTESIFDHQVSLSSALTFHWNDINGNSFEARLIHKAASIADAPSWLGFGIYDTFTNTDAITESSSLMVGSDAIIGIVSTGTVKKYALDGKQVAETDGVHLIERQTLISTKIKQHNSDDGSVITVLTFEKLLEESDFEEVRIRHIGENVFLWAIGSPGETALGMHSASGAIKLDLGKVQDIAEGGGDDSSTSDNTGTSSNTSPVVSGSCDSTLEADMMVELTPTINFHWTLNDDANPPTLTGIVEYEGEAWVAFAISQNGKMVGSTAIIGLPDSGEVQKYDLTDKSVAAVTKSSAQTLQDASIEQNGGKTILRFTKLLNENNEEVVISPTGLTTFLVAVGSSNELAYHEHRSSFRLDLQTCSATTTTTTTTMSHGGAFVAHGTIATLAWGIASPFAITVAWFRTLVPSSWIYIHVFANVLSFVFTLVAVIIAISAMSLQSSSSHFSKPHHWVGIVMLVALTFQVMNGFLRPPVEKKDPYHQSHYDDDRGYIKCPRSPREIWYFTHRFTGISMLAMGIYQIQSGLNLYGVDFDVSSIAPLFWLYVGIFAFVLISLKVWIMLEEYKARRGMENIVGLNPGNLGGSSAGMDQDEQLMPVSFDRNAIS